MEYLKKIKAKINVKIFLISFFLIAIVFCLIAFFGLKALSKDIEEKFYAVYDSIPSRVYSNLFWLKKGVSLSEKELKSRLKERGYKEIERPDFVRKAGDFHLAINEDGLESLVIYPQEFDYPPYVEEVFFEGQRPPVFSNTVRVEFGEGFVTGIYNNSTGEIIDRVPLEPVLVAQLNEGGVQARKTVPIGEIPHTLMKGIVLTEDQRFLEHSGIDPRGILRSIYVNIRSGAYVQGASTITQQLARNIYLSRKKTIRRKIKEMIMSVMLEFKFSKDEILEKYLNEVYFGQAGSIAIHGVSEAAKFYFNKNLSQLTIAEQAVLAGLVRGPFYYSPFRHFDRAKSRQEVVLKKMLESEAITQQQYDEAIKEKLEFTKISPLQNAAPYFTDMVLAQLLTELPEHEVLGSGYSIFTTLDPYYQSIAEAAVQRGVKNIEDRLRKVFKLKDEESQKYIQGVFLAVDPKHGYINAVVGGRSYEESTYNRAILMRRQIGSLVKPFVYLSALIYGKNEDGTPMNAISKFEDRSYVFEYDNKKWSPKNYEDEYLGTVTMRFALANSINTVAAKVAVDTGLENVITVAKAAGIETEIKPYPSLSLGAIGLSPLEIATAYTTLANFGNKLQLTSVIAVIGSGGVPVAKFIQPTAYTLPPEETANLVQLMTSVFDLGTAKSSRAMGFYWPAAGKTGTTNEFRDSWFAGFSEKMLAINWVGFDRDDDLVRKQRRVLKLTGAAAALPIWSEFMKEVHLNQSPQPLQYPEGVLRTLEIDLISGGKASYRCMGQNVVTEVFTYRNAPTFECGER
ncbi:MAG: PBP1A family penicillin-binding protein [Oligoflexia bacterium]|nr:PBP1A family penicillin-binding protein [Oligoflexia bacterium]